MEYQLNIGRVKQRDARFRYTGKCGLSIDCEDLQQNHLSRDIDEDSLITMEAEALVELRKEVRAAIDKVNDRLALKYPELWSKSVNGIL